MSKRKHTTVSSRELYEHYLSQQEPGEYTLTYTKWKEVVYDLMEKLSESIIRDNLVLRLGVNLGRVGVEKVKGSSRRKVDFMATRKAGRTVFHSNLHTDCYYFRFAWRKHIGSRAATKNFSLYRFKAIQEQVDRKIGTRGLARWIKECSKDPFRKDYDAPFNI